MESVHGWIRTHLFVFYAHCSNQLSFKTPNYVHLQFTWNNKYLNFISASLRLEFHPAQQENQHYPARPTSLYPLRSNDSGIIGHDPLQPEREPLRFDVTLVGAPPEVEQLVNNIKQVAEQFLYHWKTFPISKHFFY